MIGFKKRETQMRLLASLVSLTIATPVLADSPVVENVTATQNGETWSFHVTVRHGDEGWDHYADGWEVASPDGIQLGYRKLLHPHENEQPFTRSLSGVGIPDDLSTVIIRAHDSVHEWGEPFEVRLK